VFFILLIMLGFIIFLLYFSLFFTFFLNLPFLLTFHHGRERNFALNFIIIFKDIANQLTIGDIEIPFFYSYRLYKSSLAIFVALLVLLDLSVCLFDIRKPLDNFPGPQCSAKNIDACVCCHFKPDSR